MMDLVSPTKTRRSTIGALAALALTAACGGGGGEPAGGDASGGEPTYHMGLLYFAPEEGADQVFKGLFEALAEQGFEEGRNLEVKRVHAQAEIANIPLLVQDLDSSGLDVIVAMTTPCLTATCSMARNTPVVFTYVYDPIAAGAGTSATEHLPHVTGVGSFPPVEDTVALIQRLVPGVKEVGTVYNSSEANSTKVVQVAIKKLVLNHEVAKTLGITFPADLEAEAAAAAAPSS